MLQSFFGRLWKKNMATLQGWGVADRWRQISGSLHPFTDLPPSSKLEEATYTHIGPSHAHPGPLNEATKSKQCKSSRKVAQGQLHTISDTDQYLNPTKVDLESTQPMVGFRPYHSLTQLATQASQPKGGPGNHQILLGTTWPQGTPPFTVSHTW